MNKMLMKDYMSQINFKRCLRSSIQIIKFQAIKFNQDSIKNLIKCMIKQQTILQAFTISKTYDTVIIYYQIQLNQIATSHKYQHNFMKEEEQKSMHQKQMLINRLYKTKNTQNVVKPPPPKNEEDTKLLFYQTRKKSFREKQEEPKMKLLPRLTPGKRNSLEEEQLMNSSINTGRKTSRGNSFTNANNLPDIQPPSAKRKISVKKPLLQPIKQEAMSPTLPKKYQKEAENPVYNTDVATFFKMVRQKKLTADEFIYMIKKSETPNDHYNMDVVPYSEIISKKIEDYYTFSCKGVSKFVNSKPIEFITVQEWFEEVKAFNQICQYNFFINFRKWKSLKKWMKVISTEKIKGISAILEKKMFLTNSMYQKILINHKTLCASMENLSFANFIGRDPISKEDLLIKRADNTKQFNLDLTVFSKKMHENSTSGINVILKTLRNKIKKQDSKKEDALGFPQNMNYGDRSDMRQQLIRIIRLSYLLEFVAIETLGKCYISNIEEMFDYIEKPIIEQGQYTSIIAPLTYVPQKKNDGKKEVQQVKPVVKKPQKPRITIDPLFQIQFMFDNNQKVQEKIYEFTEDEFPKLIDFDLNYWDNRKIRRFINIDKMITTIPREEQLTEILVSFFKESGIERGVKNWRNTLDIYIDSLQEWDDVVGGRVRDRENSSEYIDPSFWLKEFPIMSDLVSRIQLAMKQSYQHINLYIKQFNSYLEIFKRQESTDYSDLVKNKFENVNEMFMFLVKLNQYIMESLEKNLQEMQQVSIYDVDSKNFKKEMLLAQEKNIQRLEKFIQRHIVDVNDDCEVFFTDASQKLSIPMTSINQFMIQKENIDVINKRLPEMTEKIALLNNMGDLLPNLKNQALKKKVQKTIQISIQANHSLAQVEGLCSSSVDKYKKEYKEIEKKINKQFDEMITEVQDKKWLTETGKDIVLWKPKVEKIEAQVQQMLGYEQVLDIGGQGNYDNLYTLKIEFDLRYSLWKGLEDFDALKNALDKKVINEIEVKPTMQTVQKYVKIVNQCERNLSQNPIVPRLKNMVWIVKEALPALNALKSKYLEPEHISQISQILDYQFDPNEDGLTFEKLLNLKINEKSADLIEVATKALQQSQLKATLNEVQKSLEEKMFLKDHKDTYILGKVDELTIILDEALANVNNTLSNRYVKAIRPRAEKKSQQIQYIMQIVEKWVQAQRKWMYLQNIFSAPDIKTQMPMQSKDFEGCDRFIKNHVKKIQAGKDGLQINKLLKETKLQKFVENVQALEKIEKKLEQYLESKRREFPRFYFLSNDELLQILAKAGNLEMIEQHLGKCFEALVKLYMADGKPLSETNIIEGICSPEKEKIKLKTAVIAKGNVEKWLKDLQKEMYEAVRRIIAFGIERAHDGTYPSKIEWIKNEPAQVVAVASQILWTGSTQSSIQNQTIDENLEKIKKQLRELTVIVRGKIPDLLRKVIVALITIEVHNRDIVNDLLQNQCESLGDFLWMQQLRYYINNEQKTTHKQVTSELEYGYEYLGATSRLVITPLTDRCWITITSALANKLGASPAGPAGTGKTQSTKDLAKALGRLCIVFNCSDQITANMMNKLFKGLAQQGAWACLDEFNRIDIEVLSVIAQQLLVIRMALLRKINTEPFEFEGQKIPLMPNYGCFITMNPGYAGRTQLPDNLKSLFRPVSMMIPDYAMIAEIMLFAQGFDKAPELSKKMVQLYKLSSEQLSQQDHYDFGMRAVKSLLVMAGSLKRAEPDLEEDTVLIKAMKFANIPKFVKADIPLFTALISDLFPKSQVPEPTISKLQETLPNQLKKASLQSYKPFEQKIIQLYDTFNVRFGVMLVGQAGSGKTTCFKMLAQASTNMKEQFNAEGFYETSYRIMNPKSISMGEMYGEVDPYTQEWVDGLASSIIRDVNTVKIDDPNWNPNERYWVVFDGPVDALWIENMNTVLDDNMTLCLANSQRIKLRQQLRMLFEVQDLAVASPATVSRCGMVYLSFDNLQWHLYVQSWLEKHVKEKVHQQFLMGLFNKTLQKAFKKKKNLYEPFPTTLIQIATNMCSILQSMLPSMKLDDEQIVNKVLTYHYIYALIWGLCGGISYTHNAQVQSLVEDSFTDITFPRAESIFDHFVNPDTQQGFVNWSTKVPEFVFDKEAQFFDLLVPTIDTIKYSHVIEQMLDIEKPLILTGDSGVGKSVLVGNLLADLKDRKRVSTIALNFSAQTKAKQVQLAIQSKLVKKGKTLFGAKTGQKICLFIDDVNMPALQFYGAQPCIELLRQLGDLGGFYDRHKLFFKEIIDTTMVPVCAPPGGGRNQLSFRYLRLLMPLMFPTPSSSTAFKIFNSLLAPKCSFSEPIVFTTLAVFERISKELLPTPSKFQYIYNMRDIGKVIENIGKGKQDLIVKLFVHELRRVFADRMVEEDYTWFKTVVDQGYKRYFTNASLLTDETFSVLFTDILKIDSGVSVYEEVTDKRKLFKILQGKQEDYNFSSNDKLDLVFFDEAVQQILRICRILRTPRGNAMLIGVGGSGKQSLSKLSSFIMNCEPYQIELIKNYNSESFRGDLQKITKLAGGERKPLAFIFTDVQIAYESFLEDINNILNTGEVPNLFSKKEDIDEIYNLMRPYAAKKKVQDAPEPLWNLFISCIRENLHIILCMSPVGEQLRVRCRKFPSLINCCSLDWFPNWPKQALIEVANKFIKEIELPEDKIRDGLTEMCMHVNVDVGELCDKYMKEMRRKVYITPKSYLDHIKLYQILLANKKDEIQKIKRKLSFGLEKLYNTNEIVAKLQEEMTILKPKLAEQSIKTQEFLAQLAIDTEQASKVEAVVQEQAELVNGEQQEIKVIADDAQFQLSKALPALAAAADALKRLNKNDITEIKGFANPPAAVTMVLEAVCIVLGEKGDWQSAKKVMMQMGFLDRLKEFDKNALAEKDNILKKLRVITRKPQFDIEDIGKKSVACKSLAMWVKAMDNYAKISKEVEPKKKKVAELTAKLDVKNRELKVKQDELQKVKEKVQKLQKQCDETMALKKKLEEDMIKTNNRLQSAEKLTVLLEEQGIRWKEQIDYIAIELLKVIGDVFLSAATISYLGPFTGEYRDPVINAWKQKFDELSIPYTETYSLSSTLEAPLIIREWIIQGLSNDALSIDNGVIATKCQRWPLFIDPQGQAHKWIKKHEENNNLKIINFSETHYLKTIQTAIQSGYSILLENVQDQLEPAIDTVLQKQVYEEDNRKLIRVGDKKIDYDNKFKMFITTKLANPNYLPEIYIKVTVINFSITFEGLKDQLLGDVVKYELPEVEKQRDQVVVSISNSKKTLKQAQDNILTLLSESKGMILDNIELIQTLQESKKNSAIIKKKLEETTAIQQTINESRNMYIPIAIRGTVLYFVISDLAGIDPMYQFSLTYFKKLFLTAIETSEKQKDLEKRLDILLDSITKLMFTDICRGLFESHKKIYSFLICTSIRRQNQRINFQEWNLLVRGSIKPALTANPDPTYFSQQNWDYLSAVSQTCVEAKGLLDSLKNNLTQWKQSIKSANFVTESLPEPFHEVNSFTKLMMIRGLAPQKIMKEFSNYVSHEMGSFYDQIKTTTIDEIFKTLDYKTPLIFILSTGADPTSSMIKYAQEKGKVLSVISLGQGQGKKAEKLITRAKSDGSWVLLTNCHLAKSWMSSLQKVVLGFGEDYQGSENFRLILTSMPADYFPVPVLQNGSKLTLQPPRGLKANLKKSFVELNDDFFNQVENKVSQWHKLVFSLTFFHAIIQERRKFGPLGFNIRYEFNDSDLSIAYATLSMFLNSSGDERVPWDAMLYMTGHINYGGRVTDDWDRVCLLSILKKYYNQTLLDKDKYELSSSKIYFIPLQGNHKSYVDYIQSLPNFEDPEVFGMHQNANITYQNQESNKIMDTILSIQPRVSSAASGKTPDQIVYQMAETFLEQVPHLLLEHEGNQQLFVTNQEGHMHSLSIVLLQEISKFNNLLKKVKKSLQELKRAIKGLAIMSQDLDEMYLAFQNNTLPGIWKKVSYSSLKPLASWFKDMLQRVQFLRTWLMDNLPNCYWMSGFYFPQGFLTGVLQNHSRAYKIPIDTLSFKFKVLALQRQKVTNGPENGVYINGLYLDGARWDVSQDSLVDQVVGKLYFPMPVIHFLPFENYTKKPEHYRCPCYKTSNRAGVLSTTGQSTNFILPVDLPSKNAPQFWTLRGTALLCQLDD